MKNLKIFGEKVTETTTQIGDSVSQVIQNIGKNDQNKS